MPIVAFCFIRRHLSLTYFIKVTAVSLMMAGPHTRVEKAKDPISLILTLFIRNP